MHAQSEARVATFGLLLSVDEMIAGKLEPFVIRVLKTLRSIFAVLLAQFPAALIYRAVPALVRGMGAVVMRVANLNDLYASAVVALIPVRDAIFCRES